MIYHYHASSITTIYLYLSKAFYNHPFVSLYLSFYRSILSYPILSCPTYPTYPTGFFRKKHSHPPTGCHITPDPPAPPWSMLIAPSEPKSLFFEGLSKQSAVTTLNWGKGARKFLRNELDRMAAFFEEPGIYPILPIYPMCPIYPIYPFYSI